MRHIENIITTVVHLSTKSKLIGRLDTTDNMEW